MKLWNYLKSLFASSAAPSRGFVVRDTSRYVSSNADFARRKVTSGATLHAQWLIPEAGQSPEAAVEEQVPAGAAVPSPQEPAG